MSENERITRRGSLLKLGGLVAAAAAGAGAWKTEAEASGSGPAGVASGQISCVLTPELTEGPYYIPNERVRRDITEGKPGTPLTLRLTVLDASTCRAVRNAAVDIWHCDALGVYSGVAGNSGTFLRGIQRTNARGVATFKTIYPGWYMGRAVHIHVKVHIGGNVVHTGQLFFNDTLTDTVYNAAPYNQRGPRDVRDSADSIYRNGGNKSLLKMTRSGAGYIGTVTMGVHRS
jgi:protocatechuate 3,4-dioxygenase beta subunit